MYAPLTGKSSEAVSRPPAQPDTALVDPPVEAPAEMEKLKKAIKKAEQEALQDKRKLEEEKKKHDEVVKGKEAQIQNLKKVRDEAKGKKKELDDKLKAAEEVERKMKELMAEAEGLRSQLDAAKAEARDAKRNKKKRDDRRARHSKGESLGEDDAPGEEQEHQGQERGSTPTDGLPRKQGSLTPARADLMIWHYKNEAAVEKHKRKLLQDKLFQKKQKADFFTQFGLAAPAFTVQ